MASDMTAALSANSSDTLEAIEKEFKRPRPASNRTRIAAEERRHQGAFGSGAEMLALGEGKTRVFKVRQQELDADDYGQTILEEPANSMSASASACSSWLTACRRKPTPRLAGASGDFVRDQGRCSRPGC